MNYYSLKDRAYTTLASGIGNAATVAWLTSGGVFPSSDFVLTIENEQFYAATRSGNVVDISGGQFGTTKASHAIATAVALNLNTAVVGQIQSGIVALEAISGASAVAAAVDSGTTYTISSGTGSAEATVLEVAETGTYELSFYFDLSTLVTAVEGGTVTCRLYSKIDESNYREIGKADFVVASDTTHPSFEVAMMHHNAKVTILLTNAVTADRAISYRCLTRSLD